MQWKMGKMLVNYINKVVSVTEEPQCCIFPWGCELYNTLPQLINSNLQHAVELGGDVCQTVCFNYRQWCAWGGAIVEKHVLKSPLGWQNTLNFPLGWLKHDKLSSWVAKTYAKVPSWEPKHVLKCHLSWQSTLNCPLGWLKHDKLTSGVTINYDIPLPLWCVFWIIVLLEHPTAPKTEFSGWWLLVFLKNTDEIILLLHYSNYLL